MTDRPFGFLVDDFLDIIAKKVLSDQQSYVSVTHARLLWRSRGKSPCTSYIVETYAIIRTALAVKGRIPLHMAGFARMRALVSACASIAARLFDRQLLVSAYCASALPRYFSAAAVMAIMP